MVKCVAVIQDYYRKMAKVQVKVPGRPWAELEQGVGQGAVKALHKVRALHKVPLRANQTHQVIL